MQAPRLKYIYVSSGISACDRVKAQYNYDSRIFYLKIKGVRKQL